jgi:hypothetical protein
MGGGAYVLALRRGREEVVAARRVDAERLTRVKGHAGEPQAPGAEVLRELGGHGRVGGRPLVVAPAARVAADAEERHRQQERPRAVLRCDDYLACDQLGS